MTPIMMGTNCPRGEYRERERQGERESATPIRVWTITGWAGLVRSVYEDRSILLVDDRLMTSQ